MRTALLPSLKQKFAAREAAPISPEGIARLSREEADKLSYFLPGDKAGSVQGIDWVGRTIVRQRGGGLSMLRNVTATFMTKTGLRGNRHFSPFYVT